MCYGEINVELQKFGSCKRPCIVLYPITSLQWKMVPQCVSSVTFTFKFWFLSKYIVFKFNAYLHIYFSTIFLSGLYFMQGGGGGGERGNCSVTSTLLMYQRILNGLILKTMHNTLFVTQCTCVTTYCMRLCDPFHVFSDPLHVFSDPLHVFSDPLHVFSDPYCLLTHTVYWPTPRVLCFSAEGRTPPPRGCQEEWHGDSETSAQ